jgi:enhancing lycopene biosynthesis protein 2
MSNAIKAQNAPSANVLVILSGCGVFDGAEIHESVITLLHLDKGGARVTIAAPDVPQHHVVNHQTGKESKETRNVMVESARIARGPVKDLASLSGEDFDAIFLPGGFGAAKNLCTFALAGENCTVNDDVARVLRQAHEAGKPIGLICISPTIGARLFPGASLTIGTDAKTAAAMQKMGARHENRRVDQVCIDEGNRIVSTPAYMLATRLTELDAGIGKLVETVLQMASQTSKQKPVAAAR